MQCNMLSAAQQTLVPATTSAPVQPLPLPPGWMMDSGFAVFRGTPVEWDDVTGRPIRKPHPRYRPYYELATPPEPYVPVMPVVYNLCFSPAYIGVQQSPDKKTQTALGYVGCATDLWRRVFEHLDKSPEGSPLVAAALDAGIQVTLSGVWLCESYEAARQLEAIFKSLHNNRLVCPRCVHAPNRALNAPVDPAAHAAALAIVAVAGW